MSLKLINLLKTNGSVSRNGNNTHVLLGKSQSNWVIDRGNYSDFYRGYCKLVADGEADLRLAEKSGRVMPVIVEINLTFSPVGEEHYDDNIIYTFVHHIQQQIIQDIDINSDFKQLICCVLESHPVEHERDETVTLRFQLPYCRVDTEYQMNAIIPHLKTRLRSENIMKNFIHQPYRDWDENISMKPYSSLVCYGSCAEGSNPLVLRCVVGYIPSRAAISESDVTMELSDVYNPRSHSYIESGVIDEEILDDSDDADYWLPFFLSVDYWSKEMRPRRPPRKQLDTPLREGQLPEFGQSEATQLGLAIRFIEMWNTTRVLEFDYWLVLGEALYNVSDGENEGLNVWIEVTKRASTTRNPSFIHSTIEQECESYYFNFKSGRVTIETIAFHAREDNPTLYYKWQQGWTQPAIEESLNYSTRKHTGIAEAFYRCYWLEFMCCHFGKKAEWYSFNNHILVRDHGCVYLRRTISSSFYNKYEALKLSISSQGGDKDKKNDEIAKIDFILGCLTNVSFKNQLVVELGEFFDRRDLNSLLDVNPEIMGIGNGVIVATEKSIYVRNGRPEDFVTRKTRIPYRSDYSFSHPAVLFVTNWLHKMFTDNEEYNHVLKVLASVLRGGNVSKKFHILSGIGDNGKTMLLRGLAVVLGPYLVKLSTAAASTRRGDPNSASPALARTHGTRVVVMEEPNTGEWFLDGFIKQVTGLDSFFARQLRKEGFDIEPLFTLFLVCNKIPKMEASKAMKNRASGIPCRSIWVDDPPESDEEQFKKGIFKLDPFFEKQVNSSGPALLWLMVAWYPHFLREGIRNEPKIVKEFTQKYWNENDTYYQFIADNIEPVKLGGSGDVDTKASLDGLNIYRSFKAWYKDTYPGKRVPDLPTMRSELSVRWGPPVEGKWYGIGFRKNIVDLNTAFPESG